MEGLRMKKGTSNVCTAFTWPADDHASSVYVVGNFDRFLRHPLRQQADKSFGTVIEIPQGEYLFKYIVDGEYRVRDDSERYSIVHDAEGTRYHKLVVMRNQTFPAGNPSIVREEGSSLRATASSPSTSAQSPAVAPPKERKSILRRAGDMFSRKSNSSGQASSQEPRAKLPPSQKPEPVMQQPVPEKRQSLNKENQPMNGNRGIRVSWRKSLKLNRGSSVSAPLTVDTVDASEVNTKIKQWREYARTLQKWGDYEGAAVLYDQAVALLEENNGRNTIQYADLQVDLAHIYGSKQDFKRSEFHVKKALGVYKAIGFDRPERHGDLLSYLAVMVDRQKRRSDAETYYREALRVYKMNRVQGENVEITEKNLALNQRRDTRQEEGTVTQTGGEDGYSQSTPS
mmetsp:Transcript_6674/g.28465  ORF Transcript_6674/g.28465 Transcript_6674/m.28465 type:complete len:399 (-) Transcript_6674:1219-2415(-)